MSVAAAADAAVADAAGVAVAAAYPG